MRTKRSPLTIAVAVALLFPTLTRAQEAKPRPAYQAIRATVAPVMDGDLSDAAWQNAPEITGFTQIDPEEGKPVKDETRIKIVYDDQAIYFSAMMEDKGKVTPLLARRDSDLNNGDYIRISIDSQHDRLNGAAFVVNASNVQMDMILYNDIYNDNSWDAVWASATKIVPNGWTAEVRIPYSQLRFPDKPVHTWGFNISRWNPRTFESSRLVFTPKNESAFVSRFADLTGIEGIKPKRGFEIMPYGVARTDLRNRIDNPFLESSEHRMD
ncbi:MAG TPA: carbohydrate binding family 9 domain-containing protein, partial [Thermoanaerobaculia bacterium]